MDRFAFDGEQRKGYRDPIRNFNSHFLEASDNLFTCLEASDNRIHMFRGI